MRPVHAKRAARLAPTPAQTTLPRCSAPQHVRKHPGFPFTPRHGFASLAMPLPLARPGAASAPSAAVRLLAAHHLSTAREKLSAAASSAGWLSRSARLAPIASWGAFGTGVSLALFFSRQRVFAAEAHADPLLDNWLLDDRSALRPTKPGQLTVQQAHTWPVRRRVQFLLLALLSLGLAAVAVYPIFDYYNVKSAISGTFVPSDDGSMYQTFEFDASLVDFYQDVHLTNFLLDIISLGIFTMLGWNGQRRAAYIDKHTRPVPGLVAPATAPAVAAGGQRAPSSSAENM